MDGKLAARRAQAWIVLSLVLALVGCATTGKYEKILHTWLGSDVNRLIASWGPPSNVYIMPNGSKMYTWLRVGGTKVVADYNQYLNTLTASTVAYWCKTTFTVTPQGVITNWRWEGNACRSR